MLVGIPIAFVIIYDFFSNMGKHNIDFTSSWKITTLQSMLAKFVSFSGTGQGGSVLMHTLLVAIVHQALLAGADP